MPKEEEEKTTTEEQPDIYEEITLEDGTVKKFVSEEKFNAYKQETAEALKAKDEALAKEKEIEKNFSKLRTKRLSELSQEELDKLSEKEKTLMEIAEEVSEKQAKFEEQQKTSWKNSAIRSLGVTEEEDQKKLLDNFNRLKDPEDSEEEVVNKMNLAYRLSFDSGPTAKKKGISAAIPHGGGAGAGSPGGSFADSDSGKGLAKRLNLNISKPKKAE